MQEVDRKSGEVVELHRQKGRDLQSALSGTALRWVDMTPEKAQRIAASILDAAEKGILSPAAIIMDAYWKVRGQQAVSVEGHLLKARAVLLHVALRHPALSSKLQCPMPNRKQCVESSKACQHFASREW